MVSGTSTVLLHTTLGKYPSKQNRKDVQNIPLNIALCKIDIAYPLFVLIIMYYQITIYVYSSQIVDVNCNSLMASFANECFFIVNQSIQFNTLLP